MTNFITIDRDTAAPSISIFTQSTAIYAGGDPAAFLARYPSPVTTIVSGPFLVLAAHSLIHPTTFRRSPSSRARTRGAETDIRQRRFIMARTGYRLRICADITTLHIPLYRLLQLPVCTDNRLLKLIQRINHPSYYFYQRVFGLGHGPTFA